MGAATVLSPGHVVLLVMAIRASAVVSTLSFARTEASRDLPGLLDEPGIPATGELDLPPTEMTLF